MSLGNSKEPLLDRTRTASPSPAQDALKGNLKPADSPLTLRKKKSWFNCLRDAAFKGALQAKAAVDSLRADQPKSELKPINDGNDGCLSEPRQSLESTMSSSTPLRPRYDGRHSTLSPKSAISSLRQHMPRYTMKSKYGSIHSITGRPSSAMSEIEGPEKFALPPSAETGGTHKRRTSKADSLVGSIKGLGRKTGSKKASESARETSPERPAENIPLPSSPIDIPMAAPALQLDFGPPEFMSTTFNGSPRKYRDQELLKATDPANIVTQLPITYRAHVSDDPKPIGHDSLTSYRPVTPSDLLKTPVDDFGYSPPSGPGTPMPGTNFSLEVDGTNADRTNLFERSVTPTNEKERKELHTVCSLDAIAEACTANTQDNDTELPVELAAMPSDNVVFDPVKEAVSSSYRPAALRRNVDSTSTTISCPSDMPELTRQKTPRPDAPVRGISDKRASSMAGDDLFMEHVGVGSSGPPSPIRSVKLPFRPKTTNDAADAAPTFATSTSPPGRRDQVLPKVGHCSAHNDQPSLIKDPSLATSVPATPKAPISPEQSLEVQLEMQRNDLAVRNRINVEHGEETGKLAGPLQHHCRLASDDDTFTRAQELLTSDIVLPNYDNAEGSENIENSLDGGLSPHGGPLMPRLFHRKNPNKTPSPLSIRSRNTYTAGLGDADFRFSFDSWLKSSSSATAPAEEPVTPNRRSLDISIDSVSTEERQTPQISPTSTSPDRTPSMGNRLEFELTHSDRNMRYNALHQQAYQDLATQKIDQNTPPLRLPLRFTVGGSSEEVEAYELNLADFESAYASSREASPQKAKKSSSAHIGSEDSVAKSLKDVLSDNNELQKRLEELPGTGTDDAVIEIDANSGIIMVQMPEHGPLKDHSIKSASLTPREKPQTEHETLSSPNDLSNCKKFSPTSVRSKISPIRFSGLKVEGCTPSPEQTESFDTVLSSSSAGSPLTIQKLPSKSRVSSSDTLDQTLRLFSSPDSGYNADKSSVSPEGAATLRRVPSRYRGQAQRARVGKPLSELSRNQVQ